MSELQLGLLGAGILAVAGVWLYNLLQERKHRATAQRLFKGDQPDVLLSNLASEPVGDERIEPVFHEIDDVTAVDPLAVDAGVVDVTEPAPAALPFSAANIAPRVPEVDNPYAPWADLLADCIVPFELPHAVPASAIWAAQSSWRGIGKTLTWLARENHEAAWQRIGETDSGRYSSWAAALQLADRRGAISDAEIAAFFDGMQALAGQLEIVIPLPGRSEILQRAQALDEFCARVDIQFGVHVVEAQGGAFAGTKLRGVCEAAGLVLGDDGCFHARDPGGRSEFWVANIGQERFDNDNIKSLATHGVTLTIDVPCVAKGAVVYDRLLVTARQMAKGMGGVLVDVQRAPLSDGMIGGIRAKIIELQDMMNAAGIPPGSPRALKLFS
jgi:hypothetical protein